MALRNPLKHSFPIYQEIALEAILVLWLALQISMKLGSRLFPEWQTRCDCPDTASEIDWLLKKFGYNINHGIWGLVVQPWKVFSGSTNCTDQSATAVPWFTGYRGAYVMWICTIVLGISLLASLFVNRHWTPPLRFQHPRTCFVLTGRILAYNVEYRRDFFHLWGCRLKRIMIYCAFFELNVYWMFMRLLLVGVTALPVMVVATVLLRLATHGDVVVFPCCVGILCALMVYSTGRLWRLWMKNSYATWIRSALWNRWNATKSPCKKSNDDLPEPPKNRPAAEANGSRPPRKDLFLASVTLILGWLIVMFHVWQLLALFGELSSGGEELSSEEPNSGSGTARAESYVNSTTDPTGSTTVRRKRIVGIVTVDANGCANDFWPSYWPAPEGSVIEFLFPLYCLQMLLPIAYRSSEYTAKLILFAHRFCGFGAGHVIGNLSFRTEGRALLRTYYGSLKAAFHGRKHRIMPVNDNDEDNFEEPLDAVDYWNILMDGKIVMDFDHPPTDDIRCACTEWTQIQAVVLVSVRHVAFWFLLPLPAAELFLPDGLQLPCLMLLLSGYTVWLVSQWLVSAWDQFCHWMKTWFQDYCIFCGVRMGMSHVFAWASAVLMDRCTHWAVEYTRS
ncbi:uncharacterized protein LOC129592942 [Paramacrobiotus metropolitanus]|uniref:uncharacterized protein LOC129592942 n=1 Tax=Paramacrobiotus metropolitanus TaxID=2943436 RepID=UPI002445CC68|nr:uncharacterized protein LOC129592942 [Paramacrobiotus metropolitanus]